MRKRLSPGVILGVVAVVFACAGTATAGSLITSGNIKDGSIQGRDIKKGTISDDRLTAGVRTALAKAGTPGAKGEKGDTGATGAQGPSGPTVQASPPQKGDKGDAGAAGAAGAKGEQGEQGEQGESGAAGSKGDTGATGAQGEKGDTGATGAVGATGAAGPKGDKGDTGAQGAKGDAGLNGANPSTLIAAAGDSGWVVSGGGGNNPYPPASLTGGELRLQGGFDSTSMAGGIGFAKAFDRVPLETLKAFSYDFRIIKRPDNLSAPAIHVALFNTKSTATNGFTNLVFEPYQQGPDGFKTNQRYSVDALAGQWWSSRDTGSIARQSLVSFTQFLAENPDSQIVGISIDNGGTSGPGTIPAADFAAGVDNVVVGFGSSFTRYDFGG